MIQDDRPALSVAVAVKDSAAGIRALVERLHERQMEFEWEIVVCPAVSTDDTESVLQELTVRFPRLSVTPTGPRGVPAQRNESIRRSRGDLLVTCDADDIPDDDWLPAMNRALQDSALVAGRLNLRRSTGPHLSQAQVQDSDSLTFPHRFLPFGLTANLGFARHVWEQVGGFDEQMPAAEDIDFTWRAQQAGYSLDRSSATITKLMRSTASERFSQHYRYGTADVLLFRKHQAAGMRRQWRQAGRTWLWLIVHAVGNINETNRFTWMGVAGQRIGRLRGAVRYRTFYP